MRDLPYRVVNRFMLGVFKLLGLRFDIRGVENVPLTGGAVIASNHVSYLDFIFVGLGGYERDRLVRFMAKKSVFTSKISGPWMRGMKHIPVDREAGAAAFAEAVTALRDGELVGIFPEATISRSFELKEFKSGVVRMAAEAGVPVVPVILWGTQRLYTKDHPRDFSRGKPVAVTVGEPFAPPSGANLVAETGRLKAEMARLLDETIRSYPEMPPGAWWLPVSYGGSAPTLQAAKELDSKELRSRAAARVAQRRAAS